MSLREVAAGWAEDVSSACLLLHNECKVTQLLRGLGYVEQINCVKASFF